MFALKLAHPIAELSDSDTLKNLHDSITHFFHDAADATDIFVRASAPLIKFFADAAYGGKRAFEVANDGRECHVLRRGSEPIAAEHAATALDDTRRAEVIKNLFKKALGDVLLRRDGLDRNYVFVVVQTENNQSTQGILATNGKFHTE